MRKYSAGLIILAFVLSGCSLLGQAIAGEPPVPTVTPSLQAPETAANEIAPEPADTVVPRVPIGWTVEPFATELEVPWDMVFTTGARMLVAERGGAIREINSGQLDPQPVYVFEDVARIGGEAGLMGMAADPNYVMNRYIYVCYALPQGSELVNRIVRLVDGRRIMEFDRMILDNIPSARNHAGCRVRFGPDGKLYATIGDSLEPSLAQDLDSLAGKILRINPDGSIPEDNPFSNSYVYSYGHRNPQGLAWHPVSGLLYSTEHGPSGFDGPPGGDEINLIEAGGNYGWPLVSHDEQLDGTLPPLVQFTPAEAPASAEFYSSDVLPMFTYSFFFGALRGEGLVRVLFSSEGPGTIVTLEKIVSDVGRVRTVVEGADGYIYFSTSNRDGRGDPLVGDDHIYRIVPVFE
jgi:glucose/arabinose dehydrogenase